MDPNRTLRLEGAVTLAAGLVGFGMLDGPWWLLLLLALAPDLSMLGYVFGPRWGHRAYNTVHTYVGPLVALGIAVWFGWTALAWVALVWGAHIGADRMFGYGLKYPTGFHDTHLDVLAPPTAPRDT